MKKKFAVKIYHHSNCYYGIQYCNYYFFPLFWKTLLFFFEPRDFTSGLECWSPRLFSTYKSAEQTAKKFQSINDIYDYYKPHNKIMREFCKNKREYLKQHFPYATKRIR